MPGGDFIDDFGLNDAFERTDASAAMSYLDGARVRNCIIEWEWNFGNARYI